MVFLVRVEDAVRIQFGGAVVAQRQVQNVAVIFIIVQNGGDGVVRGIAGVGDDIYAGIAVITPGAQDVVRGILHFLGTAAHQAHGGNRPVDDTGFHAGVARVAQRYGDMRFLHGEDIAPALEMIMWLRMLPPTIGRSALEPQV